MEQVVIASGNKGKIEEFRRMLEPLGLKPVSAAEAGFTEDIEETGKTFAENAEIKAKTVCKACGKIAIGDDSGICVDALGGEPGIYSARYAGEQKDDEENIVKLLGKLKDVPEEERLAHFECAIVCAFPDGRIVRAVGQCFGSVLFEKRGSGGFGYDPIFGVNGKSFAELSDDEKDRISHRGKALRRLLELLEEEICDDND